MELEDITDEIRQAFRASLKALLALWDEVGGLESALGHDFDTKKLEYIAAYTDDVDGVTDEEIVQTINDDNG